MALTTYFLKAKKLGGILTETKLAVAEEYSPIEVNEMKSSACIRKAVIGVGINWNNQVPETAITLMQIIRQIPGYAAKNKINCLEMLAALVLKGILQGYLFQQQVGSQVFMKAYSNLLTQVGEVASLDSSLSNLAVLGEHSSIKPQRITSEVTTSSVESSVESVDWQANLINCSGEITSTAEEGYS